MPFNRFLIVKALVGTFNKEKALVGASSGHFETFQSIVDSSSAIILLITIFAAVQQGRGPPTSQSLMGYGFGDYASFPSPGPAPGHAPTYLSSYISALVRAEPYPAAR